MSDLAPPFGVLLVNLGTPDSPTAPDVKKFLKQFLSDPRVVDLSPWIWKPILNGIILNTRPAKVAKLYQSIWWDEGSPLMVISQKQREKLKQSLDESFGQTIPVELGMSYGNPSLQSGIDSLKSQGVEKIFVLPLYAQYSCSTVAPVYDAVAQLLKAERNIPELRINKQYFDHPAYIQALAESVKAHWQVKGQADVLLMSFHGVPLRYITEGDPYQAQCQATAELLAEALGLTSEQWRICFQSQFGKEEWIKPATDELLESLPKTGVKSVDIMCPAFSSDCLETLEEISQEGKAEFLSAGGERYEFIDCLNDTPAHITLLAKLVQEQTKGWY
ncbi:ferrochelatase [Shewanella schlegeliana]|uniref:Ferrochelatase n=1 Tax=Shewanella schlegeliana TaxID=190308 RepID=A0ABS1ST69_9GAMM|nr:ferrochelatase [Shewanella schlegeliana]MBL4911737.1 ferrochelatase [Shewanella schlegeliana]MCL1110311.1 ferrochelatase [Shewanella schlegeliana]GIU31479.1 ferrochelatase 1 [Shewanella schlegeliana]